MIPIEVQDYKLTSAWSIALEGGIKADWVNQLNCYVWLLRENGYDPQKLTVVAFLRDWSKLEAKRNRDYPQSQVMVIDVPMWGIAIAQSYVQERVALHQRHRRGTLLLEPGRIDGDAAYHFCTPEERWERPAKYAVMKEGRKSALRVLESEKEAHKWALENHGASAPDAYSEAQYMYLKPGISIVERPGEAVRCADYCNAAPWCPQFQQEKADG